jgi:hypothetical protein
MRDGREGATAPVSIRIGHALFRYRATTAYWAAIGYLPVFMINRNDALIAALQAGHRADFEFGTARAVISLAGARAALESFKTNWLEAAVGVDGFDVSLRSFSSPRG